jgi:hypothetical protein
MARYEFTTREEVEAAIDAAIIALTLSDSIQFGNKVLAKAAYDKLSSPNRFTYRLYWRTYNYAFSENSLRCVVALARKMVMRGSVRP